MLGNQSDVPEVLLREDPRRTQPARPSGWVIGTIILESVIVALAVVGSALYRTGEVSQRPREILAYTAIHAFTGSKTLMLLGALLVGAIFAKVVSTANNYLFSPSTNLINDVYVRYVRPSASNAEILVVSRVIVVGLGAWALWQSLGTTSVLKQSLYAYTIYSAALTPGHPRCILLASELQPPAPSQASPPAPSSPSSGISRLSASTCPRPWRHVMRFSLR